MTSFDTIVVPVDFSGRDESALAAAGALADGAEIRVLHVIPATAGGPLAEVSALYARLADQLRGRLREVAAALEDDGHAFRTDLWLGDEVEETLRFAADLGPGTLLVLATTPDDPPQRAAMVDALARRATCSVLLVR